MPKLTHLTVYSLEHCPNCDILKEFLKMNGHTYSERDLSTAESLTELRVSGVFVSEAPVLQNGELFLTSSELFLEGKVNEQAITTFLAGV